ncbi:hypothetical protein [Marinifilum caeruleilacunae]|uniref:Uncharacterized protein n=1 Tax=Marinifilum caeruleilacunae TaxID=2499076 RepID=A0ABX1WUM5_9BACT|nr:hypothetical protein [Marinifilum caeruleilacunae]NOU59787.1 hypothetical protein [Marinifilum caeruleilacunae]
MNKSDLISSANQIPKIGDKALEDYHKNADKLIARVNDLMTEQADLKTLIGDENLDMMKDNHKNHLDFMASLMANFNAQVLVETIIWVFKAYQNHGFNTKYWPVQLESWKKSLEEYLPLQSCKEIMPLYDWMHSNIQHFSKLSK